MLNEEELLIKWCPNSKKEFTTKNLAKECKISEIAVHNMAKKLNLGTIIKNKCIFTEKEYKTLFTIFEYNKKIKTQEKQKIRVMVFKLEEDLLNKIKEFCKEKYGYISNNGNVIKFFIHHLDEEKWDSSSIG